MTANTNPIQAYFDQDSNIYFISFSVDAAFDQPSVLENYRKNNGINTRHWQFLTGDQKTINDLARKSYLVALNNNYEFIHTEFAVFVDPLLRIRGFFDATHPKEMEKLKKSIEKLKKDELNEMRVKE